METHELFIQIAGILVAARIFAEIAAYFGSPRVIGEMVAGIILGPSLLGWIEPNEPIKLMAEIGIILLLFEIGLETDVERLVSTGTRSLTLALFGFIAPFFLGFGVSYYSFDLSLMVSMFVGGTLTATSIGVTARILSDLGRQSSREGQIVLGAAVVDDVLGVILLALLYDFAVNDQISIANAGRVMLFVAAFFVIAPIVAKLLSFAIHRAHHLSTAPGVVPTTLLALILSFSALAHAVGAPELLGGFVAGVALSRRFFLPLALNLKTDGDFSQITHEQMKPIIHIFTPVFFVMVGLSLDLSAIDWTSAFFWIFTIVITIVSIVGKVVGGLLIPENRYVGIVCGMSMVPRGEVGIIFAELGRAAGVFDNAVYTALIMVIAYTTLFSPFWIKLYYRLYGPRFLHLDKGDEDRKGRLSINQLDDSG